MATKKYKTDHYEPNDWSKNPSEKRLVAIKTTHTPNMTTEEQSKTTEIMSSKKIEAIKETFKKDSSETLFNPDCNFKSKQEESYKKYFNNELVETEVMDCSHKTCLHSAEKHESDMIAVEPKDSGIYQQLKIETKIWLLVFLRWIKSLFRILFIIILI